MLTITFKKRDGSDILFMDVAYIMDLLACLSYEICMGVTHKGEAALGNPFVDHVDISFKKGEGVELTKAFVGLLQEYTIQLRSC